MLRETLKAKGAEREREREREREGKRENIGLIKGEREV